MRCKTVYQVFVLAKSGKPLMPIKRFGKVRRLLDAGLAKPVRTKPFAIQLLYETTCYTQPLILGVDPGRTKVGIAVVKKETREPVFLAELETRNKEIPKLVAEREMYRKLRRKYRRDKRKRRAVACGTVFEWWEAEKEKVIPGTEKPITWKLIKGSLCRVANRKRSVGWLTPTANHLLQTHKDFISLICSFLPITKVKFEYNKFDIHRLKRPGIKPWQYSKGPLFGYANAREFVLERDNHRCVLCGKHRALETHHVLEKSKGGPGTIGNLVSLCARRLVNSCHEKVHTSSTWKKKLLRKFKGMDKHFQPTTLLNTIMPTLYRQLKLEKQKTFGYLTKSKRKLLRVKKFHFLDAFLSGLPALYRTGLDRNSYKQIFTEVLKENALLVYHFKQFRRHNRAVVSAQRDRLYKLDGKVVAKNRNKRTGQTFPSLRDYREHGRSGGEFDAIYPGIKQVRSGKGFKPGDVVLCRGEKHVVKGSGAKGYRTGLVGIGGVRSGDCTLLLCNTGIVCL